MRRMQVEDDTEVERKDAEKGAVGADAMLDCA